jgi:hypothetical protein
VAGKTWNEENYPKTSDNTNLRMGYQRGKTRSRKYSVRRISAEHGRRWLEARTVGLLDRAGQISAGLDVGTGELLVEFLVTGNDRPDRILCLDTLARAQTHLAA